LIGAKIIAGIKDDACLISALTEDLSKSQLDVLTGCQNQKTSYLGDIIKGEDKKKRVT
jgi:hypothetical protein